MQSTHYPLHNKAGTCSRMYAIFSVLAIAPNVSCGSASGAARAVSTSAQQRPARGTPAHPSQATRDCSDPSTLPSTHHGHLLQNLRRLCDRALLLAQPRQLARQPRALNLHVNLALRQRLQRLDHLDLGGLLA